MVIYADVLIFLNLAVNWFLLLATSKLCDIRVGIWRQLAGAAVGALFSLYIFAPPLNTFIEIFIRLLFAAVIVITCYGFGSAKRYFRLLAVFFAATFLYAGIMMGIYAVFRPAGMAVDGGVVYFDISPLVLITVTAVCYGIILLIQRFSQRSAASAKRVSVTLNMPDRSVELTAMVDTGHSLRDVFSGESVVLISPVAAKKLLGEEASAKQFGARYRLIPCRTAEGDSLLEGMRCDSLTVGKLKRKGAVAAFSTVNLGEDFDAVISPEILQA